MISTVPFDTLAVGLPHTSEHPDGIQCHLPNLEEAMIKHEKLLTTPKFVEYSCSPLEGRYDKCTKLGGIGNFLVLFPAVYLAAMLTGRELIIHDNSVLGQWCRAINCGFQFTSDVEKKYPLLFEKVKHVTQFTQNDYAYKLRINASIPDTIVGFRGMDVYASKWFQYAGALAGPCIEHITGTLSRVWNRDCGSGVLYSVEAYGHVSSLPLLQPLLFLQYIPHTLTFTSVI